MRRMEFRRYKSGGAWTVAGDSSRAGAGADTGVSAAGSMAKAMVAG
jgi:hypothetical protein